jgi:hypothetical protein
VQRLRAIEDDQETAVGAGAATLEIGQQTLTDGVWSRPRDSVHVFDPCDRCQLSPRCNVVDQEHSRSGASSDVARHACSVPRSWRRCPFHASRSRHRSIPGRRTGAWQRLPNICSTTRRFSGSVSAKA